MRHRKNDFGRVSYHLSSISFLRLGIYFILTYIGFGLFFGFLYWAGCHKIGAPCFTFNTGPLCFYQSFYFSFITQLTIGYGDYAPEAGAQLLAIFQGVLGVLIISVWAGIFVVKCFAIGDNDSIYFAKWAGYSLADERFFVLFVNRHKTRLVDVNLNAVVRLNRYDPVPPNVNPPYIGNSAWTFGLQKTPICELVRIDLDQDDGIKICISGTAGMTRCTTWKRYRLEEIYVLPDRDYYWQDRFTTPKFDAEFYSEFEDPKPEEAVPFSNFNFNTYYMQVQEQNHLDDA